ncbi:MAG: hypothetical protein K0R15_1598 [Clostridiales bacterium]|jgi:uncharacterized membrane protein YccC|nr:hypothetical protein [Clostridiales bacterium]
MPNRSFKKSPKRYNQIYLINIFRKLWEQHVMWTRSFIISTVSELGDLEYVTERLLANPSDFADALRHFYGNEKSNRFEKLLTDHLLIAANLLNNAKAGNSDSVKEDRKNFYKNGDDIITFLSQINPYWSPNKFKPLFYNHLNMVENEAIYRLNEQYDLDVKLYDMMESEALLMADLMSTGIINQFNITD